MKTLVEDGGANPGGKGGGRKREKWQLSSMPPPPAAPVQHGGAFPLDMDPSLMHFLLTPPAEWVGQGLGLDGPQGCSREPHFGILGEFCDPSEGTYRNVYQTFVLFLL